MVKFSFDAAAEKLRSTPKGKEASMYGPIRDIFVNILGYPAADVDIDTTGEGGRPDVTVRALSGQLDAKGGSAKIDWIVIEAKDENRCFTEVDSRESIFEKKSKYVGLHTAWFVMVEPHAWVIRPVAGNDLSAQADIVVPIEPGGESAFRVALEALAADKAGVPKQLAKFREGDVSMIAYEKLSTLDADPPKRIANRIRLNRKRFFQQIRAATEHLQVAVGGALARIEPEIQAYQSKADEFWVEFGKNGENFDQHSLTIYGKPEGPDQSRQHDRAASRLKREFAKAPHIARLALKGLPDFQARTGVDEAKLKELFAIETANLILARVLLLRFFEDHGFFGDTRYVCNGGVHAFQNMREYFKASYAKLLEQAYQEGSRFYASAFDETELDWIFGVADETLSNAIEWTLFRFARYDFITAKGDILTGIYDRFMNREQRKKLGEFYTPPSIARYIVKRLGIHRDSRVFDPSCGSGTFLIESYRAMVGQDVERGAAEYVDVLAAMERIAGNDLNTFSAILAQIQLLWQLLGLKAEFEHLGFPDLRITAKVNSLVERDHFSALDRFAELDVPEYDAVVGNPPYVRAERSEQDLDNRSKTEFERGRAGFPGISSKLNAYALFLYRALDRWCKPADANGVAGRVGFVIPVSFFDSNDTAQMRRLFAVNGRWAIREIVDLEVIYREVFDADVLPAILIVENCPAKPTDTVSIKFADHSCVSHLDRDALPEFALESLPEERVPYASLFSPDGRILTRITTARLTVLSKLWANDTFADVAKPYWVRKEGAKIAEWTDKAPSAGTAFLWEERKMIGGGIAFRGTKPQSDTGIDVYKGENIVATELQGAPALTQADLSLVDDKSLWRYSDILPRQGLAVARVAHCPNGVMFDPMTVAFTNTATLLFPRHDCRDVPFDLILMSNIYVWFYALAARMGILRTLRSDVYPTNLAFLPWNQKIAGRAADIESLRNEIVASCHSLLNGVESLRAALDALKFDSLKARLTRDKDTTISWGENYSDPKHRTLITEATVVPVEDVWRVQTDTDLFDSVDLNREDLALGLAVALHTKKGEEISKSELLNLPIPVTEAERKQWTTVISQHQTPQLETAMAAAIAKLDAILGKCLGLASSDIKAIQVDLETDPFLQGIRPRYPGTVTRKQGFRSGLDAQDRYS
jgi:hypothetical protein